MGDLEHPNDTYLVYVFTTTILLNTAIISKIIDNIIKEMDIKKYLTINF